MVIVILSSSIAPGDRQTALALGANRYIHKPSNLGEFMEIGGLIRRILAGE
jgi:CheY-like chemotaxis protein